MKNNKGFAIVVAVLAVGSIAYYTGKSSNTTSQNTLENSAINTPVVNSETKNKNTVTNNQTSGEDSSNEVFNNQPGAVKSIIVKGSNQWVLAVDLLSGNSKWTPDGSDSNGRFFINQNTKIRNLTVTKDTKTYNCGGGPDNNGANPNSLQNTSTFLAGIQTNINSGDYAYNKDFVGPTYYFDINRSNITAIYQQCLP